MAKFPKSAPKTNDAPKGDAPAADAAPKAPASRGPKGVPETATIKLLATGNPKRPSSKSFARFATYRDGMTVKESLDAGNLTADLIWDTKHGFIEIDGYTVPGGVLEKKAPKPKAEKAPKKEKAEKTAEQLEAEGAADAEANTATMD